MPCTAQDRVKIRVKYVWDENICVNITHLHHLLLKMLVGNQYNHEYLIYGRSNTLQRNHNQVQGHGQWRNLIEYIILLIGPNHPKKSNARHISLCFRCHVLSTPDFRCFIYHARHTHATCPPCHMPHHTHTTFPPVSDTTSYAHYIFNSFDHENKGTITFEVRLKRHHAPLDYGFLTSLLCRLECVCALYIRHFRPRPPWTPEL